MIIVAGTIRIPEDKIDALPPGRQGDACRDAQGGGLPAL